jgi:ABC-type nitrate/sulfonate/bicarbonate transport system substrate-binding protein
VTKNRWIQIAATSAAYLVAMSAFALNAAPAGARSTARPGANSMPWATVNIGLALSPPKAVFFGPYVAQAEGFFAREHLKVNFVSMPNGLETELGTTTGAIQIGFSSATDSIEAAAAGSPVEAVWSYGPVLDTVCIGAPSIHSAKDLIGKPVGSTGADGFSQTLLTACLAPAGVSTDQVHQVDMTRAAFVPALLSGRIYAAVFHADDAYVVLHADPKLHVLEREYQSQPNWWYGGVAVKTAWAQSHAQILERFLKACVLADRWMYQPANKQKVIDIGVKASGESAAAVTYAYNFLVKAHGWTLNIGVTPQTEMYTARQLLKFKEISSLPPFSKVVNLTYIDAVLKQIGTVNEANYP